MLRREAASSSYRRPRSDAAILCADSHTARHGTNKVVTTQFVRLSLIAAALAAIISLFIGGSSAHGAAAAPNTLGAGTLAPGGRAGGLLSAVAVAPGRLLVGEGAQLVIYTRLADGSLQWSAEVPLPGVAQDVAYDGGKAYIAAARAGLQIVDLDAAGGPRLVGGLPLTGNARGVVVSGPTAYVAADIGGLRVVDVGQPTQPTEIGHLTPGSRMIAVTAAGSYVYLADQNTTVRVVDVSQPKAPSSVTTITDDGPASVVVAQDGRLYVGIPTGLRVYSLADPAHPAQTGRYPATGADYYEVYSLALDGGRIFVGHYQYGVEEFVLDAGGNPTPVCPPCLATFPYDWSRANLSDIAAVGDKVYIADGDTLRTVTFTSGQPFTLFSTLPGFTLPSSVALADGFAYVGAQPMGLAVVDLRGSHPHVVSSYYTPKVRIAPDISGVAVNAGYVVLAGGDAGFHVFGRTDPAAPTYLNPRTVLGGVARAIVADGDTFVGAGGNILYRIQPATLSATTATVGVTDIVAIATDGSRLYVARQGGLEIVSWPVGGSVTPLGQYNVAGTVRGVDVDGSLVALAHDRQVDLLLVAGATPTLVGTYATVGIPTGISLAGSNLFVTDSAGTLDWVNVTAPAAPTRVAQQTLAGYPTATASSGSLVVGADRTGGLYTWRALWARLALPLLVR
ncbi:MAG: hypothetical protein U0768_20030 [Anaerolineae bacterium]